MNKVVIKSGRVVKDTKVREKLSKEQQNNHIEKICIVLENFLNNIGH